MSHDPPRSDDQPDFKPAPIDRFRVLPRSLAAHARTVRLARNAVPEGVPALLIHPDWIHPAPTMLWIHGRTAYKEIDAGRFSRWLKRGIAAVSIDLPGHGELADERGELAAHTLDVLRAVLPEIDHVVEALADPVWQGVFDLDRIGLGGMSLGGMATLRRLCMPPRHEFKCAAVECTSGDLRGLYDPIIGNHPWGLSAAPEQFAALDPMQHLTPPPPPGFVPLPLLALHSEADAIVPWPVQAGFLARLRAHYAALGTDPALIEHRTWPTTGAPQEHAGFGLVSNEAKEIQADFLARHLISPRFQTP